MSKDEMPLQVEFINFTKSRVWAYLQEWFDKRIQAEKDTFFEIEDEDEQAQRRQVSRVRTAEELAGEFRAFVLNTAGSKERKRK